MDVVDIIDPLSNYNKAINVFNIIITNTDLLTNYLYQASNAVSVFDQSLIEINDGLSISSSAVDGLNQNVIELDNGASAASSTVDELSQSVSETNDGASAASDAVDGLNQSVSKVNSGASSATKSLGKFIKKIGSIAKIKKVLSFADEMSQTSAKLGMVNDGLQSTQKLQDMVTASANRSRASFLDTANIVSSLSMGLGNYEGANKEAVAFAENLNKMFAVAGTSQNDMSSASQKLAQALSKGVVYGKDLNAVWDAAPNIIQSIADNMGVPIEQLWKMADNGELTAEIMKNAVLASTDQINTQFASLPMTFSQAWTVIQNNIADVFQPLLELIASGAQWISENWSSVEPIFVGAAAAIGAFTIGLGIMKIATIASSIATQGLNATLMANPLILIVALIGLVVAAIYKWAQSVGGFKIAWMIVADKIMLGWDKLRIAFTMGGNWIMDVLNFLQIGFRTMSVNVENFVGDMKANVLMLLQDLVNGAIGIINNLIEKLNKIPGVSIDVLEKVTFGTNDKLENEAKKQARNHELENYIAEKESDMAERDRKLAAMNADAAVASWERQAEIAKAQEEAAASTEDTVALSEDTTKGTWMPHTEDPVVVEGTGVNGKVNVDMSDEDIQYLRDIAERDYINKFTTATLAPNVTIKFGDVRETADVDSVRKRIEEIMKEEIALAAEGVY